MAHKRPDDLPFELPPGCKEDSVTTPELLPPAATAIVDEDIEISVPLDPRPAREFQIHIDTTLTGEHATTLRRIAAALDRRGCVTRSGTRVTNATQALRYLLELVNQP